VRIHTPTANAVPSTSKSEWRRKARGVRAALASEAFAERLAAHADALRLAGGATIAGYHAHQNEADPARLLLKLAKAGAHVAFPRIVRRDAALEFHLVPEGEILKPGAYGIHEPLEHWPRARPDILLVPLLAFDAAGYRLGTGGGYYDRTLAALPHTRAIGIAYAGQRVDILPRDAHDWPLNAVLTENGLTEFPR
jgi:5-formyltetrahydrofolate cyclo-ligase